MTFKGNLWPHAFIFTLYLSLFFFVFAIEFSIYNSSTVCLCPAHWIKLIVRTHDLH